MADRTGVALEGDEMTDRDWRAVQLCSYRDLFKRRRGDLFGVVQYQPSFHEGLKALFAWHEELKYGPKPEDPKPRVKSFKFPPSAEWLEEYMAAKEKIASNKLHK